MSIEVYKSCDFENDPRLTIDMFGNLRKDNKDEKYIFQVDKDTVDVRQKVPFPLSYIKIRMMIDDINPDDVITWERDCKLIQDDIILGTIPSIEYIDIIVEANKKLGFVND